MTGRHTHYIDSLVSIVTVLQSHSTQIVSLSLAAVSSSEDNHINHHPAEWKKQRTPSRWRTLGHTYRVSKRLCARTRQSLAALSNPTPSPFET